MCIFCERAQNQLAGGLTTAQKREAEQCERLRETRIRATILTGFLGAGKTTFLNFVLKSLGHGKRIGVVQNEFGSISVDDQLMLVERSEAEVITMPNGCLCCRVRGDTVEALKRLAERQRGRAILGQSDEALPLDSLVIECSGLSEVIPVAQTFFADPFVQASFQLDGVVCVCDAAHFDSFEGGSDSSEGVAGADVARLLREQLSISDVCLLNKCDLVNSAQRDRINARIRELSPSIKVVPCRYGKVNLGQVLMLNSFSLESVLSLDAHFLGAEDDSESPIPDHGHGRSHSGAHEDRSRHEDALGHAHANFSSLGLEMDGVVDINRLKAWLRGVVEKHGDKLIRIKGVLRTSLDLGLLVVVQGVGGHIDVGEEAPAPRDSSSASRLVLIGRSLDFAICAELRAGFLGLRLAQPGVLC